MREKYTFKRPMHRLSYHAYRRRLKAALGLILILVLVGTFLYIETNRADKPTPKLSAVTNTVITDNEQTITSPYFKFTDTQKWVFDKSVSSADRYTYQAFNGVIPEGQLNIYINQVPDPFDLAVSRVLPVRIVNNSSFQVTGVSEPCGTQYGEGVPKVDKNITVGGAGVFCNPDNPEYTVAIAEIDGNYQLNMVRANGTPIQLVITYLNQDLNPTPDSIVNIASSFQVL